jgi:hypothetical protein
LLVITFTNKDGDKNSSLIGIFMCIVGASFHAAQEIVEEIMLKNVETQDVLHLTGWEGMWGMIMTAISLLIFVEFECPFD